MAKKTDDKPHRVILVRCQFKKPSAALSQGEDGENFVKMSAVIPDSDINRATVAEDFFHRKQLKIQFSRRGSDKWDDNLPGMEESLPEILECQTDVQSYNRQGTGYKISWLLSHDLLDYDTAFCEYAGAQGSLRITLLGDMVSKAKKEKPTAETVAAARPLQGQQSLLDDDKPKAKTNGVPYRQQLKGDEFVSPDEYMVPSKVSRASTVVTIGENNGRFYWGMTSSFVDQNGEAWDGEWGNPMLKGDGFDTLTKAVAAAIGKAYEYQEKSEADPKCLKDLKAEIVRLADGGEPIPVPEE